MKYAIKKYYNFGWLVITALVLILFSSISYYLESEVKSWMKNIVREELLQDAHTISSLLSIFSSDFSPEFTATSLDPLIDSINKNNNSRVTILDSSGTVLADSHLSIDEVLIIENHKNRPEILSASDKTPGESFRYSNTLQQEMLYLAIPFQAEGIDGFVRIAHSLEEIEKYTNKLHSIQKTVALIGVVILGIIIAFSYGLIQNHNNIQKRKLRKKVKQKTRHLLNIQKFSEMLASCANIDELAELVSSTTQILFPNSSGALSITQASMDYNEVISHWGKNWKGKKLFQPSQCWAHRKGAPYISNSNSVELKCTHLNIDDKYCTICVPLFAQSVVIGALHIVFENSCSNDARNRFITIADNLSLAVANINLRESLKKQATRDPLTNLYNRRFLDESLKNEILRAERNQQSLAVLMIDVDHFKRFNDSFGHDAGDYTLQQVGKVLSKQVRGEDIACRFGGEEFIVLFPNIVNEDLEKRANELLQAVRDIDLTFKNKPLDSITMSIGVATYPTHGLTADELINTADMALYKAKSNGRNQVVMS